MVGAILDLKRRSGPSMRQACSALICSVFRYQAEQLTAFPGAGIASTARKFCLLAIVGDGRRRVKHGVAMITLNRCAAAQR